MLLAAVLTVLTLASCVGGQGGGQTPEQAPREEPGGMSGMDHGEMGMDETTGGMGRMGEMDGMGGTEGTMGAREMVMV
ncbi:hypothetical protein JG649_18530, partial [Vibrio cholerae]|nr:hypothetical protein [Vibrio cholerae]